jgi:hypothetical protein
VAVQRVARQALERLGAEAEQARGQPPFPHPVHLVGDDAEGIGAVPVGTALADHEPVHVLVDLPQRSAFAHLAQDQLAVRGQVGRQPVLDRVGAEGSGAADVGGETAMHRGHVQDERHPRLQPAVRGEELQRDAEARERRAVAEPGEGQVEPVPHAPRPQPLALHAGRVPFGHARLQPGGHGLGARVGETLHLPEAPQFRAEPGHRRRRAAHAVPPPFRRPGAVRTDRATRP